MGDSLQNLKVREVAKLCHSSSGVLCHSTKKTHIVEKPEEDLVLVGNFCKDRLNLHGCGIL